MQGKWENQRGQGQTRTEHEWNDVNNGDDRERPQMADDDDNDSQALTGGDITWYRALVDTNQLLGRMSCVCFNGSLQALADILIVHAERDGFVVGKSALLTHDVEKSGEQTHPAEYVARTPISFNAGRIDGSCTQDPCTWSDSIFHDRADAPQGSSDVFLQHNAQQIGIQLNTVHPGVQLVLTFSLF